MQEIIAVANWGAICMLAVVFLAGFFVGAIQEDLRAQRKLDAEFDKRLELLERLRDLNACLDKIRKMVSRKRADDDDEEA